MANPDDVALFAVEGETLAEPAGRKRVITLIERRVAEAKQHLSTAPWEVGGAACLQRLLQAGGRLIAVTTEPREPSEVPEGKAGRCLVTKRSKQCERFLEQAPRTLKVALSAHRLRHVEQRSSHAELVSELSVEAKCLLMKPS